MANELGPLELFKLGRMMRKSISGKFPEEELMESQAAYLKEQAATLQKQMKLREMANDLQQKSLTWDQQQQFIKTIGEFAQPQDTSVMMGSNQAVIPGEGTRTRQTFDANKAKGIADALTGRMKDKTLSPGQMNVSAAIPPQEVGGAFFGGAPEQVIEGPEKQSDFQSKEVLVDGKQRMVGYDPVNNQYVDPDTQQPLNGVQPIPDGSMLKARQEQRQHRQQLEDLANTIMQPGNEGLLFQQPASIIPELTPILASKGFNQFGTQIEATQLEHINMAQSALDTLDNLQVALEDPKFANDVGPIQGWLKSKDPGFLESSKSAQQLAQLIDNARQTIGKFKEGGVLRKEDELKYEIIIGSNWNRPDVLAAKLDELVREIRLNLKTRVKSLRQSGRSVSKTFDKYGTQAKAFGVRLEKMKAGETIKGPNGNTWTKFDNGEVEIVE